MTALIPLVLDFESPFDSDFTLKKMPTAQYVRDERFDVLGAGVRLADRLLFDAAILATLLVGEHQKRKN